MFLKAAENVYFEFKHLFFFSTKLCILPNVYCVQVLFNPEQIKCVNCDLSVTHLTPEVKELLSVKKKLRNTDFYFGNN